VLPSRSACRAEQSLDPRRPINLIVLPTIAFRREKSHVSPLVRRSVTATLKAKTLWRDWGLSRGRRPSGVGTDRNHLLERSGTGFIPRREIVPVVWFTFPSTASRSGVARIIHLQREMIRRNSDRSRRGEGAVRENGERRPRHRAPQETRRPAVVLPAVVGEKSRPPADHTLFSGRAGRLIRAARKG
jgi:hypothetical protein